MGNTRGQAVRKPAAAPAGRHWTWFAGGVVTGALTLLALQFAGMLRIEPAPSHVDPLQTSAAAAPDTSAAQEFEFWTRLPQSEVVVPHVEQYQSGPRGAEETGGEVYILQAGSFRSREDADRLRAELILLGLDVNIEKIVMQRGDTWHRVQTGPYVNRQQVREARHRLAEAGIEAMLLKRKRDG